MGVVTEGLHEIDEVLVDVGVRHDLLGPHLLLGLVRQLAVDQKVGDLGGDDMRSQE